MNGGRSAAGDHNLGGAVMSKKTKHVVCWLLAFVACGLGFYFVTENTLVPVVKYGTGPNGVSVGSGGWLTLVMTVVGMCGTFFGTIATALHRFTDGVSPEDVRQAAAEVKRAASAIFSQSDTRKFLSLIKDAEGDVNRQAMVWDWAWERCQKNFVDQFGQRPVASDQAAGGSVAS